jgi:sulfatase modifying factor 1
MASILKNNFLIGLSLSAIIVAGCRDSDESKQGSEPDSQAPKQITTKTGIEMVLIPAGEFTMGSDKGEDDEQPPNRVKIDAFYMDKLEVTQEAYEKMMVQNPAKFKGTDRPVERVSWFAAVRYCNMRSLREGLTPCYDLQTLKCNFQADGYRLPTEAEWEYACRAGTNTIYYFGNTPNRLGQYAWYRANANKTSHPVGLKKPNPWGLYDMHGNVWEWCNDFYDQNYYHQERQENPIGPSGGDERVLRGGSWASTAESSRSSARYSEAPGFADVCFGYEAYGFRCVRRAVQIW